MKKIILCSIVKNESKIIQRFINSVLPIIDGLSICDTGSTDNTVELVDEYIEKYGGVLYNHTWINFGYNRTMSFNACIKTANKLNFKLEDTYALLLDADMELEILSNFIKNDLIEECYLLNQTHGDLKYYNERLIRLDNNWSSIGVTHEYWQKKTNDAKKNKFDLLNIHDHGDGGCKDKKFERDINFLIQGIIDEPTNNRYIFYLAQSYRDINDKKKSIELYKNYINKNIWDEEKWYSMMQIGILSDIIEEKFYWLLAAYEFRPCRSESLYYLINYCRENKLYNQCVMFAIIAINIVYPDNDSLFIEYDIYKYKILYELSIGCFYTIKYKSEGYEACKKLLKMVDIPEYIVNSTIKNIKFYEK